MILAILLSRWFPFLTSTACCAACGNLKAAFLLAVVSIVYFSNTSKLSTNAMESSGLYQTLSFFFYFWGSLVTIECLHDF